MPDIRIPPLPPEEFSPAQAEQVGDWKHLVFTQVLIRHPALYAVFLPFLKALVAETGLPPRDRQIVVLRMLALADETYEKAHHIEISRKTGLTDAEIAAVLVGEGGSLSPFDRVLMNAAAELHREQRVADDTWAALAERYSQEQRMELVYLAGCYQTMAMLTKSFGIPLESDAQLAAFNALRDYA